MCGRGLGLRKSHAFASLDLAVDGRYLPLYRNNRCLLEVCSGYVGANRLSALELLKFSFDECSKREARFLPSGYLNVSADRR